jgi:UDP:flavonoid glycosyltransferase YjiC (YdhE family)
VSTIVFVEMPAFGHVNPSLPLARELVRRGERVIHFNDAEFQWVVEAAGAEFAGWTCKNCSERPAGSARQPTTSRHTSGPSLLLELAFHQVRLIQPVSNR